GARPPPSPARLPRRPRRERTTARGTPRGGGPRRPPAGSVLGSVYGRRTPTPAARRAGGLSGGARLRPRSPGAPGRGARGAWPRSARRPRRAARLRARGPRLGPDAPHGDRVRPGRAGRPRRALLLRGRAPGRGEGRDARRRGRSEEHTSELQSRENLVCRLLLEKK